MKTQKTWFITGASRGFGLEITNAVLASGDKVIATVRSNAEQLLEDFNQNPDLMVVTMDVTVESQVKNAVEKAIGKFGKIDVLVNNTGYGLLGKFCFFKRTGHYKILRIALDLPSNLISICSLKRIPVLLPRNSGKQRWPEFPGEKILTLKRVFIGITTGS